MLTSISPDISASRIVAGFTTCPSSSTPVVTLVELSDKTLGVHKVTSNTTHALSPPSVPVPGSPPDALAWEAVFPAGSINPGNKTAPPGGFGFYLRGPPPFAEALKDVRDESEVVFSYDVLFEDGFDWVKGGKLPGICKYSELLYLHQTL